jgi:hypothetical protein
MNETDETADMVDEQRGIDVQQKVVMVDIIAIALAVRPSMMGIEHLSFPPLSPSSNPRPSPISYPDPYIPRG